MSFFYTTLKLAVRNLRAHFRYFFIGLLTITAGHCGLTLFQLYIVDAIKVVSATFEDRFMLGDIMILPADENVQEISEGDQEKVVSILREDTDQVVAFSPVLDVKGIARTKSTVSVFIGKGIEPIQAAKIRGSVWEWDTVAGKPMQLGNRIDDVQIGTKMASVFGCETNPEFESQLSGAGYTANERPFSCPQVNIQLNATTSAGQMNLVPAKINGLVDGVFQELDARLLYMPLSLAQTLLQTKGVSYYSVRLHNDNDVNGFIKTIAKKAQERNIEIRAISWKTSKEGEIYRRVFDVFRIFRSFIISILIVIACLSVFYSFQKSTLERSNEIGTLRSIGFKPTQITALFLGEAILMAIGACAIGASLGLALTQLINNANIQYQVGGLNRTVPFTLAYNPSIYFYAAGIMIAVSVVAALVAIISRLRFSVADNLKAQ
jgi:ABC-type lipoprotein release transport system permease subunit